MITAPANWNDLWSNPETALNVELSISLDDNSNVTIVYGNSDLFDCTLEAAVFGSVSVGNVSSAHLRFIIVDGADYYTAFRDGQKVAFNVYLSNGETQTDSVSQGVFYIDGVLLNDDGSLEINAYDGLYKLLDKKSHHDTDISFSDYMTLIKNAYGFDFDVDTALNTAIKYVIPSGYSTTKTIGQGIKVPAASGEVELGKVLSSIATCAGCNFAIDKSNVLRAYGVGEHGYYSDSAGTLPATASTLRLGNEMVQCRKTLNIDGAFPYQGMAINGTVDDSFNGTFSSSYAAANMNDRSMTALRNVSASGVNVAPLFELGDFVNIEINDTRWKYYRIPVYQYSMSYIGWCWGDISFPMPDDSIVYVGENLTDVFYPATFRDATSVKPYLTITGRQTFTLRVNLKPSFSNHRMSLCIGEGIETVTGQIRYAYKGVYHYLNVTAYLMNNICYETTGDNYYQYAYFSYVASDPFPDELINGSALNITNYDIRWKIAGTTGEGTEVTFKCQSGAYTV